VATQPVNHGHVGLVVKGLLNVKVITVNSNVLRLAQIKGTRAVPRGFVRTESVVEEVGKLHALLGGRDVVVAHDFVVDTADAQQDLDAEGLAVRDVLLDSFALSLQVGLDAVGAVVLDIPAPGAKVASWQTRRVVLRGLVDKGQGDIVDASVTVCPQALATLLAPVQVEGPKGRGHGGEGCQSRHCEWILMLLFRGRTVSWPKP
jgi:hypothetical protein